MGSESPQFSQLTIRKGLCGILQDASCIKCDEACQETLRQHLDNYLSDKFPDGSVKERLSSYFYTDFPLQFHTITHDPISRTSWVGYHFWDKVEDKKRPGESKQVWRYAMRSTKRGNSSGSPEGPNRVPKPSEGAAIQHDTVRKLTLEEISKSIVGGSSRSAGNSDAPLHKAAKAAWAGSIVESFKRVKEIYSGELADVMLHYTDPRLSPSVLTGSTFYFSVDGKAAKEPDHSWPNEVVSTSEIQEPPNSPTETQPPRSATTGTQPSTQTSTRRNRGNFLKRFFPPSK
ncbi:hypothetical protein DB88DRAFT_470564 [Papiliotrema laurentii]|uniref:Uncharacterized protein n=1 Tax=Papiliotrema laurentii TaxID=5418 RepID=A0AAD9L995_PAPLA|nr:hypothetical protein DB88DRAFT_470564 [Papiliotrema laurentii]